MHNATGETPNTSTPEFSHVHGLRNFYTQKRSILLGALLKKLPVFQVIGERIMKETSHRNVD